MNGTRMNMRGAWRALVLVMVFVLSQGNAMAALSLLSSFSVGQGYTDNIFFKNSNRKSDFGTFLGPTFTLQYDNPDIVIGATYFGRLALFIKNPDANVYIQNLNLNLALPFLNKQYRGLTVSIDESMNFTPQLDAFSLSGAGAIDEESASDRVSGEGDNATNAPGGGGSPGGFGGTQGVYTRRGNAFLNRAGITLGYAWTPRVQSRLRYTNQYRHFFASGFQDSIRHGVKLDLPYNVKAETMVTPSYSYFYTKFIGKPTENTSADGQIGHAAALGINHRFTPSIRGNISGGVTFSKQKGAEETDGGMTKQITNKWRKNFSGSAGLGKTYRRGGVGLSVSQRIGSGGGLASQSTRTRVVRGNISHALSQQLKGFASLAWAKNDSVDGNAFDTNTYRFKAGLGYPFTAWLFGSLLYSHIEQQSHGTAANDLRVDSVFLGLTAVADPWVLMR